MAREGGHDRRGHQALGHVSQVSMIPPRRLPVFFVGTDDFAAMFRPPFGLMLVTRIHMKRCRCIMSPGTPRGVACPGTRR